MKLSIREILETNGVAVAGAEHKHGRHGWVQVNCPWCMTSGFHLGINLTTGAAACWRCGRRNTAAVVARLTGKTYEDARQVVDRAALQHAPTAHTGTLRPPTGIVPLTPAHAAYVRRRGLDPDEIVALWGVQALAAEAGRLRWRLYIPITDPDGEQVSWTTRAIGSQAMRYRSASSDAEAYPHKWLLYGAQHARHAISIHEGPVDAWAVGPGGVATCGTGYSPQQLTAMSRYAVRVVCFDAEPDAQKRARRLADDLSVFPGETYNVVLETGADTAECSKAELEDLRGFLR